jgi:hypothetical protein
MFLRDDHTLLAAQSFCFAHLKEPLDFLIDSANRLHFAMLNFQPELQPKF